MTLVRTEQLTIQIGQRTLISKLDWQIASSELWCVLGRNGVGKTSLLLTLAGLLVPAAGQVTIDERPLSSISPRALAQLRGMLPQQQSDAFLCSVLDTVLIGRTPHRFGGGWDTEDDIALARTALKSVDLLERADSDVCELSGGERQRVALAALLVQAPSLYLLDEPTAHQDVARQLAILRQIRQLATQQAVVMNCHDINLAARFATHVLLLGEHQHWLGPVEQVLRTELLEQTFNCRFQMIEAEGQRSFIAA